MKGPRLIRLLALLLLGPLLAAPGLFAGKTSETRPRIFLEYSTRNAPPDIASIRMILDGRDVSAGAEITSSSVSFVPSEELTAGRHDVEVVLVDRNGMTRKKAWSFEVDPGAVAEKFTLGYIAPTPANGAVTSAKDAIVAIELSGASARDLDLRLFMASGGSAFLGLKAPFSWSGNTATTVVELGDEGAKTLLLKATRIGGGRTKDLVTSFMVDRHAPEAVKAELSAVPVLLSGGSATPAGVAVVFKDPPYDAAAMVELTVDGPDGARLRLEARDVVARCAFELPTTEMALWPAGFYELRATVSDYAGLSSRNAQPVFVELRPDAPGEPPPLRLDGYPQVSREPSVTLSGRSLAKAALSLFVNGELSGKTYCADDGAFSFGEVPLREGFNAFVFRMRDVYDRPIGELCAPGVFADRRPPLILDLSIGESAESSEPRPAVTWRLEDRGPDGSSGIGLAENVSLMLDGRPLRVEAGAGGSFRAVPEEDLAFGPHEIVLDVSDRLGNAVEEKRGFRVVEGVAEKMELSCDRKTLYAWGDDAALIRVELRDRFGRPAADGTPVYFSADRGLIPAAMATRDGAVAARFSPGLKLGKAKVVVSTARSQGGTVPRELKVSGRPDGEKKAVKGPVLTQELVFEVLNAPERGPMSAVVVRDMPSALADGGNTVISFRAALLDALDQPVLDGLRVRVEAELGKVEPADPETRKGEVSFAYRPGRRAGTETVTISHGGFVHRESFQLKQRPPGPPHGIKASLTPGYAEAGSVIPVRLSVQVLDDFGDPVAGGTAVTFSADEGSVPAASSTGPDGRLIANFLAPEKEGTARILIQAGDAKKEVAVPVISSNRPEKVVRIRTDIPRSWRPAATEYELTIRGQVYGSEDHLVPGKIPVFVAVSRGSAPALVMSGNGLFSFSYNRYEASKKGGTVGQVDFELRCDSAGFKTRLEIETGKSDEKEENLRGGEIAADDLGLELGFELASRSGTVETGFVRARLFSGKAPLPERLASAEVIFEASAGEILPRAFLENGSVKLPFSYKAGEKDIEVKVRLADHPKIWRRLLIAVSDSLAVAVKDDAAEKDAPAQRWDWDFRHKEKPGKDGRLELSLRLTRGAPPEQLVTFSALHGSFASSPLRPWEGDSAKILYVMPREADSDLVWAKSGAFSAQLLIPCRELRETAGPESSSHERYEKEMWPAEVAGTGLLVEILNGRSELEAGGRDRSRLRLAITTAKQEPLADGTEVEFICPQANLSPGRAKLRRGQVVLSVQSRDWVGTYPLVVKLDSLRGSVNLVFTVPAEAGAPLPPMPQGPGFRLPGLPPPPGGGAKDRR